MLIMKNCILVGIVVVSISVVILLVFVQMFLDGFCGYVLSLEQIVKFEQMCVKYQVELYDKFKIMVFQEVVWKFFFDKIKLVFFDQVGCFNKDEWVKLFILECLDKQLDMMCKCEVFVE